ncbi:MAG: DUF5399 domain-containing protein [Verrucomicrobia bacterium]|nr:DUF5399 domain-containing protein [Verrucomicrobiota bacterium]MBS0636610.1 DUF5399 domain-containing protein [Verrucomicrobiota bacterium]
MPAVTIDKFDIGIYIQYARRTQLIEQVMSQYHLKEAGGVPAQALIVDLYPKLAELDLLLGIATLSSPWAYFYAPRSYTSQRRSPFSFHRIIPFMGERNKEHEDEQKKDEEIIEEVECRTVEEERERKVLKACFKQIEEINSLLRYIGGRIGQFLQG